jgi:hypothetical protein
MPPTAVPLDVAKFTITVPCVLPLRVILIAAVCDSSSIKVVAENCIVIGVGVGVTPGVGVTVGVGVGVTVGVGVGVGVGVRVGVGVGVMTGVTVGVGVAVGVGVGVRVGDGEADGVGVGVPQLPAGLSQRAALTTTLPNCPLHWFGFSPL